MRKLAIILTFTLWFAPYSVSAEKSTPLIFERDIELKEIRYVTSPTFEELNQPIKPTPPPKVTNPKPKKSSSNSGRDNTTLLQTKFAPGYCTDYVAQKVKVTWSGNANQWLANATAQGYRVDFRPLPASILVTNESRYGHVAYIESVEGSKVTISEWNYAGRFKKTIRTLDISDKRIKGIIHTN